VNGNKCRHLWRTVPVPRSDISLPISIGHTPVPDARDASGTDRKCHSDRISNLEGAIITSQYRRDRAADAILLPGEIRDEHHR